MRHATAPGGESAGARAVMLRRLQRTWEELGKTAARMVLPADHPLIGMDNVVLTPHIGGATYDTEANHTRIVADDLARLLRGERPIHCANPEVLP